MYFKLILAQYYIVASCRTSFIIQSYVQPVLIKLILKFLTYAQRFFYTLFKIFYILPYMFRLTLVITYSVDTTQQEETPSTIKYTSA
jgi:hypothetical protein